MNIIVILIGTDAILDEMQSTLDPGPADVGKF
jgi:hypothetical protein